MTHDQSYPDNPELPVGIWSYQPGEFGSFQLWQQTESGLHYVGSVNSIASADFIVERLNGHGPLSAAQGKPDRDKLATMLKANGFTSRDGTYLQGGTYGVIDAVLSALSSTASGSAAK